MKYKITNKENNQNIEDNNDFRLKKGQRFFIERNKKDYEKRRKEVNENTNVYLVK